jgi:hypothetical protein
VLVKDIHFLKDKFFPNKTENGDGMTQKLQSILSNGSSHLCLDHCNAIDRGTLQETKVQKENSSYY